MPLSVGVYSVRFLVDVDDVRSVAFPVAMDSGSCTYITYMMAAGKKEERKKKIKTER